MGHTLVDGYQPRGNGGMKTIPQGGSGQSRSLPNHVADVKYVETRRLKPGRKIEDVGQAVFDSDVYSRDIDFARSLIDDAADNEFCGKIEINMFKGGITNIVRSESMLPPSRQK